jgi:hypothetical protein
MAQSRAQFGKPRRDVEGTIEQWHAEERQEAEAAKQKHNGERNKRDNETRRDFPRQEQRGGERRPRPPREREREREREKNEHTEVPSDQTQKDRPPLGGAKSLREALASVAGGSAEPATGEQNLKGVLEHVASSAKTEANPERENGLADRREENRGPFRGQDSTQHSPKPKGLPEGELKAMLAVDEIDGQGEQ